MHIYLCKLDVHIHIHIHVEWIVMKVSNRNDSTCTYYWHYKKAKRGNALTMQGQTCTRTCTLTLLAANNYLVFQNWCLISSKPYSSATLIPIHLAGVNSNLSQYSDICDTNPSQHSILISFSTHLKNEKV
jgi:hypothetical protein